MSPRSAVSMSLVDTIDSSRPVNLRSSSLRGSLAVKIHMKISNGSIQSLTPKIPDLHSSIAA
jgi:hypothetical protein